MLTQRSLILATGYHMVCLAQNGMLGLDQLRWLVAGWVGGTFCVASYVHGHHSVWVTDAWRVLQAIYQGEIYTNMMILICAWKVSLLLSCCFPHSMAT